MNSSYFAVPGRGGASAGMPPAQCGIASLTPAASFSLMVPQPLSPDAEQRSSEDDGKLAVTDRHLETQQPYMVDWD